MWIMLYVIEIVVLMNYYVLLILNRLDFIDNKFKII